VLTGIARPGVSPVAYLPPNRAIQIVESAPPQTSDRKTITKPNGFLRFSKWAHNIFSTTPSKKTEANFGTEFVSTPNLQSRQPPELPPRNVRRPETRVCTSIRTPRSDEPPPLPPRPKVPLSSPSTPSVAKYEQSAPPVHLTGGQPQNDVQDQGRGILLESIRTSGIGSLKKVAHNSKKILSAGYSISGYKRGKRQAQRGISNRSESRKSCQYLTSCISCTETEIVAEWYTVHVSLSDVDDEEGSDDWD
jgi:hypothetical protein